MFPGLPICPSDSFTTVDKDKKTKCYTFHSESRNWHDAAAECKKFSSRNHLVSIDNPEEQAFLLNTIKSNPGELSL